MPASDRYYGLDAMRGIGAIAVLQFHAEDILPVASSGYLAVDFFFALSGFVLAKAYEKRLNNGLTGIQFIAARYRRLYPLYVVGIMMGAALFILKAEMARETISELPFYLLFNITMLPVPVSMPNFFPLNHPAWTLFLEMAISIAFGFAMYKLLTSRLAMIACISGLLLVAATLHEGSLGGWDWGTLHIGILRVMFSFSSGVVIARISVSRKRSWFSMLPLCVLLLILYFPQRLLNISTFEIPFEIFTILIASPLVLLAGSRLEVPTALIPIGRFLGDISYPVYAIHFSLLSVFREVFEIVPFGGPGEMVVLTVGTIIIAYITKLVLDKLMNLFKARGTSIGLQLSSTRNRSG